MSGLLNDIDPIDAEINNWMRWNWGSVNKHWPWPHA